MHQSMFAKPREGSLFKLFSCHQETQVVFLQKEQKGGNEGGGPDYLRLGDDC